MKNNKMRIIIPCILCAAFLAGGVWMMVKNIMQMNHYTGAISQAQQALTAADPANAQGVEMQAEALQEENAALQEQLLALQAENETLSAETDRLQLRADELNQSEDTVYYQTILESLQEGVSRVEEYIGSGE